MKLAIIGYGTLGKQIETFIIECNLNIEKIIYFDDIAVKGNVSNSFPFPDHLNPVYEEYNFIVALGYKHLQEKNKIQTELIKKGRKLFTLIHKEAYVSNTAIVGKGCIVYPGCIIDNYVKLDDGVLLNNGVIVSHDCEIDSCCFLAPGVILSGRSTIHENCFIGTGTMISNDIKIGANSTIGIGSVITKNIEPGSFIIGNPMKVVKKINLK
jgi:sugar O-acyltransferase (sialic acid O-acetyltransferase NeuD family)